jgi:hypothetical protein
MIIVYVTTLTLLAALRAVCSIRARSLKGQVEKATLQCKAAVGQRSAREGNSGRSDPIQEARLRMTIDREVAQLARVEGRHAGWEGRRRKLDGAIQSLRGWRGRKVPYVLGFLDAAAVTSTLAHFGYGTAELVQLIVQRI